MLEKPATFSPHGNNKKGTTSHCSHQKHHIDNWQTILASSFKRPNDLLDFLGLPPNNSQAHQLFAMQVPRPFAQKMKKGDINDPLLKQVLPVDDEFLIAEDFSADPLKEKHFNHISGLLHKYQSRVLLTLKGACAINCRYCFRRHFDYANNKINPQQLIEISSYIEQHPSVNEVIFSGGDPLMAKDHQLQNIMAHIESILQIKRIRFHTRLPVVIPERITKHFVQLCEQSRLDVIMVLHINHPNEIDTHFKSFILRLKQAGVLLLNQSVLLKSINDEVTTQVNLSEKLFDYGILPYYLFCLDKVAGAAHFNIEKEQAKQLIKQIAEALPGYLVPKLAYEDPDLKSKNMWV